MDTPKRYEVNVESISNVKRGICRLESDCIAQRVMAVVKDFIESTSPKVDGKGRMIFDDRELERCLSNEVFLTISQLRP